MNEQIQIQKQRADYMATHTAAATSRQRYGDSWRKVILLLVRIGYDDKMIAVILGSLYMTWAADDFSPTAKGFQGWMRKNPRFFTPVALAVLMEVS
jgi:hypothetical protein